MRSKEYLEALLKRDPNSFDGHRLRGDWDCVSAKEEFDVKKTEESQKHLDAALEEYRKADSIKPGDLGVNMQLGGRPVPEKRDLPAAEQIYRKVIDQKKDFLPAYRSCIPCSGRRTSEPTPSSC